MAGAARAGKMFPHCYGRNSCVIVTVIIEPNHCARLDALGTALVRAKLSFSRDISIQSFNSTAIRHRFFLLLS